MAAPARPPAMTFADSLFGGSRFLRWTLFAVATLAFVLMAAVPYDWSPKTVVAVVLIEGALALLALAMIAPRRCAWAGRVLCGLVFLAYVWYLGLELREDPGSIRDVGRRSESSAGNALLGLIVIGLPALAFALGWHPKAGEGDTLDESDELEPWEDEEHEDEAA